MSDDTQLAAILAKMDAGTQQNVRLTRTLVGIGFLSSGYAISGTDNLMKLYSRCLAELGDEPSYSLMGLDRVIGRESILTIRPDTASTIDVDYVVAWVHMSILEYLEWYTKTLHIPYSTSYAKLANFLGETIGMDAMRRILLALLTFMSTHADEDIVLADEFATEIEQYLAEHEGEDEGVVTFNLSETPSIRAFHARH